jgi:hypothetical protein
VRVSCGWREEHWLTTQQELLSFINALPLDPVCQPVIRVFSKGAGPQLDLQGISARFCPTGQCSAIGCICARRTTRKSRGMIINSACSVFIFFGAWRSIFTSCFYRPVKKTRCHFRHDSSEVSVRRHYFLLVCYVFKLVVLICPISSTLILTIELKHLSENRKSESSKLRNTVHT